MAYARPQRTGHTADRLTAPRGARSPIANRNRATGRHDLPMPLGLNTVRRDLEDAHGRGTLEEIAATLDLPLPTVKTRLFRARKALKDALKEWR